MLSARQKRAIAMMASGQYSQADIARELHVAEQTLCTWKKRAEFVEAFEETLAQAQEGIAQELQIAAKQALDVLVRQLSSKNEFAAQNAARDILTRAGVGVDGKGPAKVVVSFGDCPSPGEAADVSANAGAE